MKKIMMICCLLLSVVTFAKAQTGDGAYIPKPEDEAILTTLFMTKLLDLNPDQQTKVKAIYLSQAIAMEKLRVEGKTDEATMEKKMKSANDAAEEKVYPLLNEEQKKTFDEMREKGKSKEKSKGKNK